MDERKVVSRAEWLAQRKELLAKEKELTRLRDALNAERRRLPLVRVEKRYTFQGPVGSDPAGRPFDERRDQRRDQRPSDRSLLDLFEGRRQLIVCHIMFHADRGLACIGCSLLVDGLPRLEHFHSRETTLVLMSRAPLEQLAAFQARMQWNVPWYSSLGSDFNYDYHVTTDEAVRPVEYNYRDKEALERRGQTYHIKGEQQGVSVFLRDEDAVFHGYSTYGRGEDHLCATYNYLDLTPFGRGEGWGGMPDLTGQGKSWLRHHDRYEEG